MDIKIINPVSFDTSEFLKEQYAKKNVRINRNKRIKNASIILKFINEKIERKPEFSMLKNSYFFVLSSRKLQEDYGMTKDEVEMAKELLKNEGYITFYKAKKIGKSWLNIWKINLSKAKKKKVNVKDLKLNESHFNLDSLKRTLSSLKVNTKKKIKNNYLVKGINGYNAFIDNSIINSKNDNYLVELMFEDNSILDFNKYMKARKFFMDTYAEYLPEIDKNYGYEYINNSNALSDIYNHYLGDNKDYGFNPYWMESFLSTI